MGGMITPPPAPIRSSDGRFEMVVEEFWDRASVEYTTHLKEVASGETLFTCQGAPASEFLPDGTCVVHYFGYQPHGVRIHLLRREFRLRESDPWLPLHAWSAVEGAFGRGWTSAWDYKRDYTEGGSTWVEAVLAASALAVTLLLLRFRMGIDPMLRVALCVVAAAAFLFFAWLWLGAIRVRRRMLTLRNPRKINA
jgi:hypothetical protein